MSLENKELEKIASGAGIFFTGLVISKFFAYVYRLIAARFGTVDYGLVSIGITFYAVLAAISMLGLGEGVTRYVTYYNEKNDQARVKGVIFSTIGITLATSLILAALLFFLSDWISIRLFNDKDLSIILKIFAFAVPLDPIRNIFGGVMRAYKKVQYDVYAKSITENFVKVALTAAAVAYGFGLVGVAVAYPLSLLASVILFFYFMQTKVFHLFGSRLRAVYESREIMKYSWPLFLSGFVFLVVQWTDTIMLGLFSTVSNVGVYNAALPTAYLLYMFPFALSTLFFPILIELNARNEKGVFSNIYMTVTKWNLFVNLFLLTLFVAMAEPFIRIFFGKEYVIDTIILFGNEYSVGALALVILSIGFFLAYLPYASRDVVLTLKKTKLIFFNMIIASLLNIILNYMLIPLYGVIGAAFATALSFLLIGIMLLVESFFLTGILPFSLDNMKPVLASAVIISVFNIAMVSIPSLLSLLIASFAMGIAYLLILFVLRFFDYEDKLILKTMLRKIGL